MILHEDISDIFMILHEDITFESFWVNEQIYNVFPFSYHNGIIFFITAHQTQSRIRDFIRNLMVHSHRCTPEITEPAPFLSWHGAESGGFLFFPVIRINNYGLSGAYTLPACSAVWAWRPNTRKIPHGTQTSWGCLLCFCFCVLVSKNMKTPKLSPRASWWHHYTGRYRISRSAISVVFLCTPHK